MKRRDDECPMPTHGPLFDGATYEPKKDKVRLKGQMRRVWFAFRTHRWLTLAELSEMTGDPEASVSARLRDLRKPKWGAWKIDRRRRSPGTFEYRMKKEGEL